jgi:hypothetical protein
MNALLEALQQILGHIRFLYQETSRVSNKLIGVIKIMIEIIDINQEIGTKVEELDKRITELERIQHNPGWEIRKIGELHGIHTIEEKE